MPKRDRQTSRPSGRRASCRNALRVALPLFLLTLGLSACGLHRLQRDPASYRWSPITAPMVAHPETSDAKLCKLADSTLSASWDVSLHSLTSSGSREPFIFDPRRVHPEITISTKLTCRALGPHGGPDRDRVANLVELLADEIEALLIEAEFEVEREMSSSSPTTARLRYERPSSDRDTGTIDGEVRVQMGAPETNTGKRGPWRGPKVDTFELHFELTEGTSEPVEADPAVSAVGDEDHDR